MTDKPAEVAAHYDAAAADYHRQYQRDNLDGPEYPANYYRLQIIVNRLAMGGTRRLFEIGVGEGTPLLTLARMGFDVGGCDISEAMVAAARRTFAGGGLDQERIGWGDVQDAVTLAGFLKDGPYDAAMALGVLPHVQSDEVFLANLRMMVRPGGRVMVEFRNKLFSLFTFNRFTRDFILDDLLRDVAGDVRDAVAAELAKRCRLDLPPMREAPGGGPSYDQILARYHNPFELTESFARAGFRDVRVHWYHYHPAPPMLESALGPRFNQEARRLEHEASGWRGYFLCSAGVIEAVSGGPA